MAFEVSSLGFAYRAARPVLRGVTLAVEPGMVTGVVGPNGAGKSTLLRLLAGVLSPVSGTVRWDGESVSAMAARARARRVAYVPQSPSLAFAFTVRQYVSLGRFAWGAAPDGREVRSALGAMDLDSRRDEPFATLSAGQQQRAAIARALAQLGLPEAGAPGKAMILDEPLAAQDPRHALIITNLLRGMAGHGLTVVLTLHDLAMAARICDRAVVLDADGRVATAGPAGTALAPGALGRVFGVTFDAGLVPSLTP